MLEHDYILQSKFSSYIKDTILEEFNKDPKATLEDHDLFNLEFLSVDDSSKKSDYRKVFTRRYNSLLDLLEIDGIKRLESFLSDENRELFRIHLHLLPDFNWNEYTYIDLKRLTTIIIDNIVRNFYFLDRISFNLQDYFNGKKYTVENNCILSSEYVAAYLNSNKKDEFVEILKRVFYDNEQVKSIDYNLIEGILTSNNEEAIDILVDVFKAAKLSEGLRSSILSSLFRCSFDTTKKFFQVISDENLLRFSSVKDFFLGFCGYSYLGGTPSKELKKLEIIGKYVLDCSLNNKVDEYLESGNSLMVFVGLSIRALIKKDVFEYIYNNYEKFPKHIRTTIALFLAKHRDRSYRSLTYHKTIGANNGLVLHLLKLESDPTITSTLLLSIELNEIENTSSFNINPIKDKEDFLITLLDKYEPLVFQKGSIKVYTFDGLDFKTRETNSYDLRFIYAWILKLTKNLDMYYERSFNYLLFEKSFDVYLKVHSECEIDFKNPYVKDTIVKGCLSKREKIRDFCHKSAIERLNLTREDFIYLSSGFKSKSSDLRKIISNIIKKSDDDTLVEIINDLLLHKSIQYRNGGLSLIMDNFDRLNKANKKLNPTFDEIKELIKTVKFSKEMEEDREIILNGEREVKSIDFFDENYDVVVPKVKYDKKIVKDFLSTDYTSSKHSKFFKGETKSYVKLVKEFYKIIEENKGEVVEVGYYGTKQVIGEQVNYLYKNTRDSDSNDDFNKIKDSYMLSDKVLERIHLIKESDLLTLKIINKFLSHIFRRSNLDPQDFNKFTRLSKAGKIPHFKDTMKDIKKITYYEFITFNHSFNLIEAYYRLEKGVDINKDLNKILLNYYIYLISLDDNKLSNPTNSKDTNGFFFDNFRVNRENSEKVIENYNNQSIFNEFNNELLNRIFDDEQRFFDDNLILSVFLNHANLKILYPGSLPFILKLIQKGLLEKDFLYRFFFDDYQAEISTSAPLEFSKHMLSSLYRYLRDELSSKEDMESDLYKIGSEMYVNSVNYMLDIELQRSEVDTKYSEKISYLNVFPGVENFAKTLFKMGDITFLRGYNWRHTGKKHIFSKIIAGSIPERDLTQEEFNKVIGNYDISKERLIEAGMYNLKYITFIENYLGFDGLTELAYYFKVHSSERWAKYSQKDLRIIKRYSDIDIQDFRDGQMDINWFKRAYKRVGKKNYELVYDAAKYTTSGGSHKRAQYFADAVLGKLKISEVEKRIFEKRNKDMVLAYGLIPIKGKKDNGALKRYKNIQKFLKESKEFGAQRRASERTVCNIALNNLARNYGVSRTRFQWIMEGLLIDKISKVFSPQKIEDTLVHISLEDPKTPKLVVVKGDKILKSVPTKIKKNKIILELNEVKKELKIQYSRSRLSLEKAMNDEEVFTFSEVERLYTHPVISKLIKNILFSRGDKVGFISEGKLICLDEEITLNSEDELRITHPIHFKDSNTWAKWQEYIISKEIKQPFKQVFREIYVMNEDERSNKGFTERFAGYQIEPRKTFGILKSREWMVNEYDGFEKVDHKHNLRIDLYCYADWFTPAAIEAPTLERVVFMDNKNNEYMDMKEINKVFFSEIMRDIDLVVSTAYVGGVDPLLNHSTTQMRSRILKHNLDLFKISNYEIKDNYVYVDGEFNRYSIHLGSGIVHVGSKGMLPIFPVHSSHRGKIFLPFVDEDPKTSEIITKVITLAKDNEIKDPDILKYL